LSAFIRPSNIWKPNASSDYDRKRYTSTRHLHWRRRKSTEEKPPGGTSDILALAVAQKMSEGLSQAIVVDNRPGASETIGTDD
jgi:hypothetical protein